LIVDVQVLVQYYAQREYQAQKAMPHFVGA